MSIISSFKKALGFPNEYDEDLDALEFDDDNASIITPKRPERSIKPQQSTTATPVEAPTIEPIKPIDTALPGEVFDAVIELFNAIQPEFVSPSPSKTR